MASPPNLKQHPAITKMRDPCLLPLLLTLLLLSTPCLGTTSTDNAPAHPRQWVVQLPNTPADQVSAIATRDGFVNRGAIPALPGYWIFEAAEDFPPTDPVAIPGIRRLRSLGIRDRRSVAQIHKELDRSDRYGEYMMQERRPRYRRGAEQTLPHRGKQFIPEADSEAAAAVVASQGSPSSVRAPVDEEVYSAFRRYNDPLWSDSWQVNSLPGGSNASLNIFPAWRAGFTGKGTPDASPKSEEDNHGTRCAGEIVGIPNNGKCSVGIAHDARVTAIKVIGDKHPTDAEESLSFTHLLPHHSIYSSSWGPRDDGASLEGPAPLALAALEFGTTHGRNGRGSIYVFAAGNGGHNDDNCNADGYANSPYTIAVGSLQADGTLPYYGEKCSAHLIMGLGGAGRDGALVATTDIHSGCTLGHTGTSAAAPQVAGMIALVLQARPDLGWRDVQHLLVRSTVLNDRNASDWEPNRAGFMVHPTYAFGLVDGGKLIANARKWVKVPIPQLVVRTQVDNGGWHVPVASDSNIPGGNATSVLSVSKYVSRADIGQLRRLEHVLVTVDLRHPRRGKVQMWLIGPEGRSRSLLMSTRRNDMSSAGFRKWTMTTEEMAGGQAHGVLDSWQLEFRGRCDTEDAVKQPDGTLVCGGSSVPTPPAASTGAALPTAVVALAGIVISVALVAFAVREGKSGANRSTLSIETSVRLPRPGSIRAALVGAASRGSSPASAAALASAASKKDMIPLLSGPSNDDEQSPGDEDGASPSSQFESPTSETSDASPSSASSSPGSGKSLRTTEQLANLRTSGSRRYNNDPSATPYDMTHIPNNMFRDPASVGVADSHLQLPMPAPPPRNAIPPSPRSLSPMGMHRDELRKTRSASNVLPRLPSLPRFQIGANGTGSASPDGSPGRDKGRHND
ncbi:peptidase S8/S53 domain-containing protein [Catenaria anguillulae PL171]|uniref:Peptidase S8/S53 domain-containing protein n=1 Tax=Catenaria anguillulae PL171 TaxID=765915 RepID=A0A1Y2HWK9_9FUNG|nr:peptidase S8/S53 domain-containing protein [Catenaria anguillulae PL171]